ncbi:hypothetical protein [Glaciecola sp. MF2-115]|uniref:hypothetical protein n=1 Tax=Glaciecola sp. MF2-115 TaxID=3384827 RepID=UPI0039A394A3
MCVEPYEHQLEVHDHCNADSYQQSVIVKSKKHEGNDSELMNSHAVTPAMPLMKYCALITNGSEQRWVEKLVVDEGQFRDYLNVDYPFFICLFCEENDELVMNAKNKKKL